MGLLLDAVYGMGLLVASPKLLGGRKGKGPFDWSGRMGKGHRLPDKTGKRVLIHAVSLGEVNLIRMLVDQLEAHQIDVVVASTTNTGYDRAVRLFGSERVVRYPFDFTWAVERVLDRVNPDLVVTAELEVWPNLIERCHRRGIGVAVVNGRLSAPSFRGYQKLRFALRQSFARLAAVGAQTQAYADRFVAMGVPPERVSVLDTMKWDTANVADHVAGADELASELGLDRSRPIVVLGSTGVDEERVLVDAIQLAKPGVQIVIVPRKPERFDEVAEQFPGVVRRSTGEPGQGPLYLLDTLGELRRAYAFADVVVVGRSFNGWGGSDPIEPVAIGKLVVMGPDVHNFQEVVDALVECDGMRVVPSPAEAGRVVAEWLAVPESSAAMADAGRRVILSRQGATSRYVAMIQALLTENAQAGL
ncbi:3-deoxy-D-manno-octulosonic acid transferase [Mucisphaera calidilacus]|uniref:3-deoxy-D-manno-octulosonic acid transferase n=1 Tax=Mucisphaera calidilacus TaxID=2527982 RepID=A0A518BZU7_9BACT|nr:glycosyltransferase N-terminal domain-containing protein [Mucisphaera calidilacus]QDU72494.1 3-deoxy-D-manno-octulosonic acid transferase [Mucisphaera calidilacus]